MTDRTKDELLAWVANNTATDEERREAEAYLEEDSDARQELKFLEKLREGVKAARSEASPGELGLARLRRRIAEDRRTVATSSTRTRWWQAAAIAATVLVAVQAAFLFGGLDQSGSVTTATGPAIDGPAIQVTFVGEASEAAIRDLLLDLGLEIVEGPSAVGVYRLGIDPNAVARDVVEALKAHPDIVSHAEIESGEP